uniref:Uncharacterized protein n=1 Tax=Anguilla anguilla TaxID=7936 RepID=A0A0E9WQP1_ANGAN
MLLLTSNKRREIGLKFIVRISATLHWQFLLLSGDLHR